MLSEDPRTNVPQTVPPLAIEELKPFPLPKQLDSLPKKSFEEFVSNKKLIKGYMHQLETYKSRLDELQERASSVSSLLQEEINDTLIPQYQEVSNNILQRIKTLTQLHNEFLNLETVQYQSMSSTFNEELLKHKFKKLIERNDEESREIVKNLDSNELTDNQLADTLERFKQSRKTYHFRKEKLNRWEEQRVSG
ncbi:hypothetical protein I9W82_000527 [Candida metapsilosis]|uniref:VPS37 C-terminal domain-containing protein n=1 Tax=Candida metapsilosis TaxID=273372 RepID=A0A8H7ZG56_9ASCO|nr:hypothetical protein I9W82_000527 [Candida metapsilosis]